MPPPTPLDMSRRHDLDALRAFAMLLGVLFHAALPFAPIDWMVGDWKKTDLLMPFIGWVHGFRMPLFIFVSGYFTQMMWRRRGAKATLQQRFLRVFLPLVAGMLTVLPLQDLVVARARARAAAADAVRFSQPGMRAEVVEAVRSGDLAGLATLLGQGADPNQSDPEFRQPAIAWAAHLNRPDAARLLAEKGADVNLPSPGGHRALHSAAYFAHPEVLEVLLKHGADPRLRNDGGEAPYAATAKRWNEVTNIAAALRLPWPRTEAQFQVARAACRESLARHGGAEATAAAAATAGTADGWLDRSRAAYRDFLASDRFRVTAPLPLPRADASGSWHLVFTSLFDHLWFLWYLCWLVALYALARWAGGRLTIPRIPTQWLLTPAGACWLIPVTMIPQLWMGVFGRGFGPDTSVGLLPQPHLLLYYGIFFAAGALYHESDDVDGRLGRRPWILLGLSTLVLMPLGLATIQSHPLLSGVFQVGFAWGMSFGCIGLFRRWLRHENPRVRYLADSAYWLYIAHHPLVALLQSWMRPWDLPALLKWVLLSASLVVLLLVSYRWLVRDTWIGWLLNGRRMPRRTPAKA